MACGACRRKLPAGSRQHGAPLAGQCRAGPAQISVESLDVGPVLLGNQMPVEQGDAIAGGIVLSGDEQGLVRDGDPQAAESGPHRRAVQDGDSGAGVGGTGLPTAGAAV